MLSHQVKEYYIFLNNKIKEFESDTEIIFKFSNEYKENTMQCLKKVLTTTAINTSGGKTYYGIDGGKLIESFKTVVKEFKNKFNFFDVFSRYTLLKNDINMYLENNKIEDKSIKEFFEEVDNFFILYQSFMQSDNDIKLALDLGQCVKEFEKRYKTLKICGESAENNLLDLRIDKEENDELKQINIQLLDIEYSFEEFINKLQVINAIYCEVGNVIYKQKSYAKLKIIKVESGSLLSMILGDKNIIESIAILFNKTVNLVFNKYTYEGKIYRHREFREELLSDAEAIQELKKLGYDVEKAQENNQEALTMLTKDLLSLANSSSKIKIDEKEYNINAEVKQKFLESGNILKLSSAENEN